MERPPKRIPSFFKVLRSSTAPELMIPVHFTRIYREKLHSNFMLETVFGKSWPVKIAMRDDQLYFTDGWSIFVQDNKLTTFDFLVFSLTKNSTFQVVLYGGSGCEKDLENTNANSSNAQNLSPPQNSRNSAAPIRHCFRTGITRSKSLQKKEGSSSKDTGRNLSFFTFYRDYQKTYMNLQKDFAQTTGIVKQKEVFLLDSEGRRWPMQIKLRKDGRIDLTKGWKEFSEANNLVHGDFCTFEYIQNSGNVVKFSVVSSGGRRSH